MKKPVKTQNIKEPTELNYKELIRTVNHFDNHIADLTKDRNEVVEHIKALFNKSDENIEFELGKLRSK